MHDHTVDRDRDTIVTRYYHSQPTKLSIRGTCPRNVCRIIALCSIGP